MSTFKKIIPVWICLLAAFSFALAAVIPLTTARAATNDDFTDRIVISALPFTDYTDTSSATLAYDDPTMDCDTWNYLWGNTVWYAYTPQAETTLQATASANFMLRIGVFTGEQGNLSLVTSNCWGGSLSFHADADVTYYFEIAGWYWNWEPYPGPSPLGGPLTFNLIDLTLVLNDHFTNATVVPADSLPYSDRVVTEYASTDEPDEPVPSCDWGRKNTVWYAFTPDESGSYTVQLNLETGYGVMAAYTGESLASLTELRCIQGNSWSTNLIPLYLEAGRTVYFQVFYTSTWYSWGLTFMLDKTPPFTADFYYSVSDPTSFDKLWFYNNSSDPVGAGYASASWNFGDGGTSQEMNPGHLFTKDGDYTVQATFTTTDQRTGSASKVVEVRTHDVAIAKFTVPTSASYAQTRTITVDIKNVRYPETVEVQLYKSTANGYVWVGTLNQFVPVRLGNRTTTFTFNYTFTKDDAAQGKVVFKAIATISGFRDALPVDNEVVALQTRVGK